MISSLAIVAALVAAQPGAGAPAPAPAEEVEVEPEPEPKPEVEPEPEPEPEPIAVLSPEQVQEQASAPPDPRARPSEGVHAVGSSGIAPLPPAPDPLPPSTIPRGSWRGQGWLSIGTQVTGPLAGDAPARPTVISLGGGVEAGWRIRQWIGLGVGFARQPHEVYRRPLADSSGTLRLRGHMNACDLLFVRLYAPVRGRVDPFIDVGGGLAIFNPARDQPTRGGGTVRASIGLDAWVTRNVTLGLSGIYRANFVDETVGHAWQAAFNLGLHW